MSSWERVAELDEVPLLGRKSLWLGDEIPVLLLRTDAKYYCIEDVCSHDGEPLTDGDYSETEIICPRHGARFDINSGRATRMPATEPIRVFEVEERGDGVYVQYDE